MATPIIEALIVFEADDPETSHALCSSFRERIKEMKGVEILDNTPEPPPQGSMSGELYTFGALLIAVLPHLLPSIVNGLKDIKLSRSSTSVKIHVKNGAKEIEAEFPQNFSREDVEKIAQNFLEVIK